MALEWKMGAIGPMGRMGRMRVGRCGWSCGEGACVAGRGPAKWRWVSPSRVIEQECHRKTVSGPPALFPNHPVDDWHKQNFSGRETHAGLVVIVDGVFRRVLAGKLRRGEPAPFFALFFSGAAGQKKINVMQRLCLEVFRQMLRLLKKHFSGAHVRHYNGPQISSNQARKGEHGKSKMADGP